MRITLRFAALAMAAVLGLILAGTALAAPRVSPEEMRDKDDSLHVPFNVAYLPYSFVYDGKASAEWLKALPWESAGKGTVKQLDDVRTECEWTWTDPKTGLNVRSVTVDYSDFPVVEWTLYLRTPAGLTRRF